MYTPGSLARTGDELAERLDVVDQFALQDRGDFVALGHHVIGDQPLRFGGVEGLLQLRQVGGVDDPRLVGENVEAGLNAGEDGGRSCRGCGRTGTTTLPGRSRSSRSSESGPPWTSSVARRWASRHGC